VTRIRTFVAAYVLVLALLLFAQRHPEAAQSSSFRGVVDLTRSSDTKTKPDLSTRIDAPARFAKSLWTVDQIPAERLLAPLVVLDVSRKTQQTSAYQISVDDIACWERTNGQIPLGAVVIARTKQRSNPETTTSWSGFSADSAAFLVEGRNVTGLGSDAPDLESGRTSEHSIDKYTLSHSVYVLKNVAGLEQVPVSGAVVMVAPAKLGGHTQAPVRLLALLR
jgi:kynurenine formamidase